MRIEINRDECPNAPADSLDCLRCIERFIKYPVQYERHCFKAIDTADLHNITIQICAAPPVAISEKAQKDACQLAQADWLG